MKLDLSEHSLSVYEALASPVRLRILRLLADEPLNIKELAAATGLSSAIMTMHVRKLADAGLIETRMAPGKSGLQKICTLAADSIEVEFPASKARIRKSHRISIPIGHYADFDIEPTCGLATVDRIIGSFDDPRYFWDPERIHAAILWFGKGFIEYKAPNFLLSTQEPEELLLRMEIGSEAPGIREDYPSDITFTLNGVKLGTWTSPGDFGDRRGKFTPPWWPAHTNQYGLLKQLRLTDSGTFMDGVKLSDITLNEVDIRRKEWTLRLSVEDDALHLGGLTLYGRGFGNYGEHPSLELFYVDAGEAAGR
ncbi:ArsR/SmtB family transcription factor [Gorillibacterium sp. sgz500922]|uniref:ArsR/SmtB family transcription factor n=1 Tax=Gorillibacterium sp. sgz500922 TaxID=3446694 RepID=UPI003F666AF5